MKLAYIIYNERPSSGLLRTQVLEFLKHLSQEKGIEIDLISIWQPWVFLIYKRELDSLRSELLGHGINLKSIPMALPARYFFQSVLLLRCSVAFTKWILQMLNLKQYDVVHCRGYYISYISALIKVKFKLIFDLRSLFPEENLTLGNWQKQDRIYSYWKKVERLTIQRSDLSLVVSSSMKEFLPFKSNLSKKIKWLPLGYSISKFENVTKPNLDINIEGKIVFVYCGSLQLNFWNDLYLYAKVFKEINRYVAKSFFLLLTNSDQSVIAKTLNDHDVLNYSICSVEADSVPNYLALGDVGIQIMKPMPDSKTRFGVKSVEYWASGLPILTNENVGEVCNLISSNNKLGFVLNNFREYCKIPSLLASIKPLEIRDFASKSFSFAELTKQYIGFLKELKIEEK